MKTESRSKEQRILVTMRKVLASIVKDTAPPPGLKHPLKQKTIQDIRECFKLISARERELAEEAGLEIRERPRYADAPQTNKIVAIKSIARKQQKKEES